MEELTFDNGFCLKWSEGLDGGGSTQYTDFLDLLLSKGKRYDHCLEWCSGLGAIGYSILDAGLCNRVSFMDMYEPAKDCIIINAITNNVEEKVNFYHYDAIKKLPNVKFDLVVANPPHSPDPSDISGEHSHRLTIDTYWDIHNEFFTNIKGYLNPGADVFLSEISRFSEHLRAAKDNGLKFVGSYPAPALIKDSNPDAVLMHYTL